MVEWKKLGEVCKVHTGNQLNRSDMLEVGPYPVVNGGKDYSGYTDKFNENANSITISQGGESAGFVNWVNISFWAGAHCYVVEIPEGYDARYLYHTLKNKERDIQLSKQGAGIPGLNRETLYKQVIPIPSLEEQTRIVGILDTFTSAIDNLKEQIAQRRKQYEYYRDQLLDLEGKPGVEMKTLGEVCEVTDYVANGSFASLRDNVEYKQEPDYAILVRTIDLSQNFEGDKVYIDEKAYKFLSKSTLYGGELIINNIGAGVGKTFKCPFIKERMSLGPNSIMVKTPNNNFFYYWFNSKFGQKAIMNVVTPGAMPKFNKTGFKTISLPIPSLSEQSRIVSILDTFEASIQNLEAQLKQREKQYEYYRNKLLTFE